MRRSLLALLLFCALNTTAQEHRPEVHCKHFLHGYPFGTPITNDLIIRDIYALSNNDDTKFADWVAYRLSMHEVDGDLTVHRSWKADPWLDPTETLEPKDYDGASSALKVDRGHQAPLASFKGSRHSAHTNYLSNITPQMKDLNQRSWKDLEEMTRGIVREGNTVYVMTGPIYTDNTTQLPGADESHQVPSAYWKVICTAEDDTKCAAFLFEQTTPKDAEVLDKLVSIDEVETKSGLDLFWMLDDQAEDQLESKTDLEFAERYFQ